MPKLVCLLAAALMLVSGAATAHSWYHEKCCHDKDCHPVPCEQIEKLREGWLWRDAATKQRHWFPNDRLKASHDEACHVCVSPGTTPSGMCIYERPITVLSQAALRHSTGTPGDQ
jgi:hypothetical protein